MKKRVAKIPLTKMKKISSTFRSFSKSQYFLKLWNPTDGKALVNLAIRLEHVAVPHILANDQITSSLIGSLEIIVFQDPKNRTSENSQ